MSLQEFTCLDSNNNLQAFQLIVLARYLPVPALGCVICSGKYRCNRQLSLRCGIEGGNSQQTRICVLIVMALGTTLRRINCLAAD